MLPVAYAVRNLARSPGRTAQLVIGAALVVGLLVAAAGFARGMRAALAASGDAANALLVGAGSEGSIERSAVDPAVAGIASASIAGLRAPAGQPAVSPEVVHEAMVEVDGRRDRQAFFRGVTPAAFAVHRGARLVEGRLPGPDEIIVGRYAHHRIGVPDARLAIGRSLRFEGRDWTIVGRFAAPGTVLESEVWSDLRDLMGATRRDTVSCVALGLQGADLGEVEIFALTRLDLELTALRESEYYAGLAGFFAPLRAMAWLTAGLIAAGAALAGLNTLYAAFAARIRELATLQAVGFRRRAILASLLTEALLAVGAGTVLALVVALVALDGLALPFSSGVFTLAIAERELGVGLVAGAALALLGTLPPAWRCLAPPLPAALRAA